VPPVTLRVQQGRGIGGEFFDLLLPSQEVVEAHQAAVVAYGHLHHAALARQRPEREVHPRFAHRDGGALRIYEDAIIEEVAVPRFRGRDAVVAK
jgi:hypothetical protein